MTPEPSPRPWWRRFLPRWRYTGPDHSVRATIEELIEEEGDHTSDIDPEERFLLMNALRLKDHKVDDIMVPRADIQAIALEASFPELIQRFTETHHSRLPVFKKTLDHIVGMVYLKDVVAHCLEETSEFRLENHMREMLFVSPHMRILDLLFKMRASHTHMAVVVDEFGGADGLVTIEDIVEEIVGEIYDEHERPVSARFVEVADGGLLVDARMPLEEVEEQFILPPLPEHYNDTVDTIGGWLTAVAGRVLQKGEVFQAPAGILFRIVDADVRRVKRLHIVGLLPRRPEHGEGR